MLDLLVPGSYMCKKPVDRATFDQHLAAEIPDNYVKTHQQ